MCVFDERPLFTQWNVAKNQRRAVWFVQEFVMQGAKTAIVLGASFLGVASAGDAIASDWMFRRSYHSHEGGTVPPTGEVPWSRSAYRQPYVNYSPHASIKGGWRFNNYTLQNGSGIDRTYYREYFFGVQQ